jgi:hypothetical protein
VRGERHDLLRHRRRDADEQGCHEDESCAWCQSRKGQREGQGRELHHDEALALDKVAERHQQDQSGGVAQLCRRWDEADRRSR